MRLNQFGEYSGKHGSPAGKEADSGERRHGSTTRRRASPRERPNIIAYNSIRRSAGYFPISFQRPTATSGATVPANDTNRRGWQNYESNHPGKLIDPSSAFPSYLRVFAPLRLIRPDRPAKP